MTLLDVRAISVSYGEIRALNDVSFAVEEGEIVCILGLNGAGKSSLLQAISRRVRILRGAIYFRGSELNCLNTSEAVELGIIHCPEGRELFEGLTVEENIRLGATSRGLAFRKLQSELDVLRDIFPVIKDRWHQRAATLSGGEQQMVAIARAVIAKPKLLLLDEPALGLAPKLVRTLFNMIPNLVVDGTAIVLVEQNVHAALSLAQRGYVLTEGRISFAGSRDELNRAIFLDPTLSGRLF